MTGPSPKCRCCKRNSKAYRGPVPVACVPAPINPGGTAPWTLADSTTSSGWNAQGSARSIDSSQWTQVKSIRSNQGDGVDDDELLGVASRGLALAKPKQGVRKRRQFQECEGTTLADALRRECIVVVKASYFKHCLDFGLAFQARQKIPPQFIFSGEEALALWKEHGAKFLSILSCSWLSKEHPDPDCFYLHRLVRVLKEFKEFVQESASFEEIGVVIDFCSQWQKQGDPDLRSDFQKAQAKEGMGEICTLFGHQEVTSIRLTAAPSEETNNYDIGGWTLFHSALIDGKARSPTLKLISYKHGRCNVLTLGDLFDPETEKRHGAQFVEHFSSMSLSPPLTPERFNEEMQKRKALAKEKKVDLFQDRKDQGFVTDKYKKFFAELVMPESFSFEGSGWGNIQMYDLSLTLKKCESLKNLDLSNNSLGDAGTVRLGGALSSCQCLEQLILMNNDIGDVGVAGLASALSSSLQSLGLAQNRIGDVGASKLGAAFSNCTQLQRLFLTNNRIGDVGAARLGAGLSNCASLVLLLLECNTIGDVGAVELAAGLSCCAKLEWLFLRQNRVGDVGAAKLAEGLSKCTKLERIDLGENFIKDAGAEKLATNLFSQCKSLQNVYLHKNFIGDVGAETLAFSFFKSTSLKVVWLMSNFIGDAGADKIALYLSKCTNLSDADLNSNFIGDSGIKRLEDMEAALPSCTVEYSDQKNSEASDSKEVEREAQEEQRQVVKAGAVMYVVAENGAHGDGIVVTEGPQESSRLVTIIEKGIRVCVVEVRIIPDEDTVRGRIEYPEGWISLISLSDGEHSAKVLSLQPQLAKATDIERAFV